MASSSPSARLGVDRVGPADTGVERGTGGGERVELGPHHRIDRDGRTGDRDEATAADEVDRDAVVIAAPQDGLEEHASPREAADLVVLDAGVAVAAEAEQHQRPED